MAEAFSGIELTSVDAGELSSSRGDALSWKAMIICRGK
jgi:hypothetical protein